MDVMPDDAGSGGGGGSPSLEARVGRLEDRMTDVRVLLGSMDGRLTAVDGRLTAVEGRLGAVEGRLGAIENKLTAIGEAVAEIKGRVMQSPTWVQLLVALIATWGAGATMVGVIYRLGIK